MGALIVILVFVLPFLFLFFAASTTATGGSAILGLLFMVIMVAFACYVFSK